MGSSSSFSSICIVDLLRRDLPIQEKIFEKYSVRLSEWKDHFSGRYCNQYVITDECKETSYNLLFEKLHKKGFKGLRISCNTLYDLNRVRFPGKIVELEPKT